MARWNTIARGAAVFAVGALALAACSSSEDPEPSSSGSMDASDSPAASGDGLIIG